MPFWIALLALVSPSAAASGDGVREIELGADATAADLRAAVQEITSQPGRVPVRVTRAGQILGPFLVGVERSPTARIAGWETGVVSELRPGGAWLTTARASPVWHSDPARQRKLPIDCSQEFDGPERTSCTEGWSAPPFVGGDTCDLAPANLASVLDTLKPAILWVEIQEDDPLDVWWRGVTALALPGRELRLVLGKPTEGVDADTCTPGVRSADDLGRAHAAWVGELREFGALPKEVIDAVVKRNLREIKACYDAELARDPKLRGSLAVNFVIEPDGSVKTAQVVRDDMPGGNVDACVARVFSQMRFPKPTGGGVVVVTYPFVFTPR